MPRAEVEEITIAKETIRQLKHAGEQLDLAAAQIRSVMVAFDGASDERKSLEQARMRCIRAKERIRETLIVHRVIPQTNMPEDDEEVGV